MENLTATKCNCGAVTVFADGFTNSMMPKDFKIHFDGLKIGKQIMSACDYCCNRWGIDLCGCGSGQKVGKCDGGYDECRNNIPAQQLYKQKEFTGWK